MMIRLSITIIGSIKKHQIGKLIERRINAKEINIVRNFLNGPYRFEINENTKEYLNCLSDRSKNIDNDHGQNDDTVPTAGNFQLMNRNETSPFSDESSASHSSSKTILSASSISCRFFHLLIHLHEVIR